MLCPPRPHPQIPMWWSLHIIPLLEISLHIRLSRTCLQPLSKLLFRNRNNRNRNSLRLSLPIITSLLRNNNRNNNNSNRNLFQFLRPRLNRKSSNRNQRFHSNNSNRSLNRSRCPQLLRLNRHNRNSYRDPWISRNNRNRYRNRNNNRNKFRGHNFNTCPAVAVPRSIPSRRPGTQKQVLPQIYRKLRFNRMDLRSERLRA